MPLFRRSPRAPGSRARGVPALVALLAVVALSVIGMCLWVVWDAVTLDVQLHRVEGREGCWWDATLPDQQGEATRREACIESLGGIQLGPASVVREPSYLASHEEQRAWFHDQAALYARFHDADTVQASVVWADGSRGEAVLQRVRSGSLRDWAPILMGLPSALGFVLIGSLLLLKRPHLPAARALFAFCHGAVYCLMVSAALACDWVALNPAVARWLYDVNLVGMALVGISAVRLSSWFPEPPFGNRLDPLLRHGVTALIVPLLAVEFFDLTFQVVIRAMYFAMGLSLILLIRGFLRSKGPVQRLQARWMMWGMAVPTVTVFITSVPSLFSPSSARDQTEILLIISTLAGPLAIAIAVLKYRLMDIEIVIRRTLVGAAAVGGFLFIFYLVLGIFAGELTGAGRLLPDVVVPVFLTAVIFAFLLAPLQQLLLDNLDRFFFRNRYHYRQILAEQIVLLTAAQEADVAVDDVLETLARAMEIPRALVALDPAGGRVGRWCHGDCSIPTGEDLWREIRGIAEPHLRETGQRDTSALDAWMTAQGLDLAVALQVRQHTLGVLACSGPRGGKGLLEYTDITVLGNLAASLALAMSHAWALDDLRQLNQQLEQRVEERTAELDQIRLQLYQSEKMASVGLLAAGVAHELNTPLGAVVSSADQLAVLLGTGPEGALPARVQRLAGLCSKAGRRAADIIQNLRDFSRPSQRDPELVNISESIATTLQILETTMRHAGITCTTELAENLRLLCYPALLNQVVANLALNAVQAMEPGGRLFVRAEPIEAGGVRVTVEDTGPGIAADVASRMFEPFFTTKAATGGTGLGLALTYNIVKEHGGGIRIDPTYLAGARFIVELPRSLPHRTRPAE